MKYNVWIEPFMPEPDQKEEGYYYWPKGYIGDERLCYLDRYVYMHIVHFEQTNTAYDMQTLVREIQSNPDEEDRLAQQYAASLGKTEDELTSREFKKMLKIRIPLTATEVEESLHRLENFGYIKKI